MKTAAKVILVVLGLLVVGTVFGLGVQLGTSKTEMAQVETVTPTQPALPKPEELAPTPATSTPSSTTEGFDYGEYEGVPPPQAHLPTLPQYLNITILGNGESVAYENLANCCIVLENQSSQAVLAKDVLVRLKVKRGLAIVWFSRADVLGNIEFTASGMESWMKMGQEKPKNCAQLEDSFRVSYEQGSVALERFREVIDNEGFSCPRIASGSGASLDIKVKRTSEAPPEDSPESRNPLVVRLEAKPKGGAWSEITTAQYYY